MTRPPPLDRVAAQIGVIRQLALCGQAVPARRLCAVLFLDWLPSIARERRLLEELTECLLLLEMVVLLPRLVRAVFGVGLDVAKLGGAGARHWTLQFSNGISLLVPTAGPLMEAAGRGEAVGWAKRVLDAAEAAPTAEVVSGSDARRARERVPSIV